MKKLLQFLLKAGCYGAGLLFAATGAYMMDEGSLALGIVVMLFGIASLAGGYRVKLTKKIPQLNTDSLPEAQADEAEMYWQKAIADNHRIEAVRKKLRDTELNQQLARMQQDSVRLLSYLEKHPDRILSARRFIDYYQNKTAELAEEYQELESTQLNTPKVRDVKQNLKDTLYGFQAAYEAEFQKILDHQLMDMDAEMTVMKQSMEAEGIKAKKPERVPYQPRRLPTTFKQKVTNFLDRRPRDVVHHRAYRYDDRLPVPENIRGDVVKDKIIQSALAIFLGNIGAHKFYQGQPKLGILYLLFFWTGIPGILGILEGIRYLLMSTDSFYDQYYHRNDERTR